MTWCPKGTLILGFAYLGPNPETWGGGSLIVSETDTRKRLDSILVYGDALIMKSLDPAWISTEWHLPKTTQEEVSEILSESYVNMMGWQGRDPVIARTEVLLSKDHVFGMYLGQWITAPEIMYQNLGDPRLEPTRVIRVLVKDEVLWVPIIE